MLDAIAIVLAGVGLLIGYAIIQYLAHGAPSSNASEL